MVSSISSSSANLYEIIGLQSKFKIPKCIQEIPEELRSLDLDDVNQNLKEFEFPSINNCYSSISRYPHTPINSLEEYINARQQQIYSSCSTQAEHNASSISDRSAAYDYDKYAAYCYKYDGEVQNVLDNIDYQSEYNSYMKLRGCDNEDELKILNTTNCLTKNDLKFTANVYINYTQELLYSNGFINEARSADFDCGQLLLPLASLEDIANYVNSRQSSLTYKDEVSCFKSFIANAASKDGLDDKLKQQLSTLKQDITKSSYGIDELSSEIDEEREIEREKAREEALAYKQKYNSTLIANYQS